MEITRTARQVREMPHGHERFVDFFLVHLLRVQVEPNPVVIRVGMERLA
jgi:hypothetical protein